MMGVKNVAMAAKYSDRFLAEEGQDRGDVWEFWHTFTPEGQDAMAHGTLGSAGQSVEDDKFFVQVIVDVQRLVYGDVGDAAMGLPAQKASESEMDGKLGPVTWRRMATLAEFMAGVDPTFIESNPDLEGSVSEYIVFKGKKLQVDGVHVLSFDEVDGIDLVERLKRKWKTLKGVARWPGGFDASWRGKTHAQMLGFLHWDAGWSAEGAISMLVRRKLGTVCQVDRPRKSDGRVIAYWSMDPGEFYGYHGGTEANKRAVVSFDLSNAVYLKYGPKYEELCGIPRPKVKLLGSKSEGHLGMYRDQILTTLRILKRVAAEVQYPLEFPTFPDWSDRRGNIRGGNWKEMWDRDFHGMPKFRGVATHEHLPGTTKWDIRCWGEQVVALLLTEPALQAEFPSLRELYRLDDARWQSFMDAVRKEWSWPEIGI